MQISTKTHGVIDLASAATLAIASRLMGWDGPVRPLMESAAAGSVAYSLATDYEFGVTPALSMREHLAVDAAQGLGFLAAAALMRSASDEARLFMAGYGLFALAVGALTERTPQRSPGTRRLRSRGYAALARDEERRGYLMGEGI
ncbi:hypothetical protein [Arenibaculum pallidiluteum]|uniref:hypothetical protein n=1 Tax=Arenibaculum pallidiluteum TaxID=2812559 RepID=UPI001A97717E|nr:hypothetical protein [Arenibaculum pallidiluteum]